MTEAEEADVDALWVRACAPSLPIARAATLRSAETALLPPGVPEATTSLPTERVKALTYVPSAGTWKLAVGAVCS